MEQIQLSHCLRYVTPWYNLGYFPAAGSLKPRGIIRDLWTHLGNSKTEFSFRTRIIFSVHTLPEEFENGANADGRKASVHLWVFKTITLLSWYYRSREPPSQNLFRPCHRPTLKTKSRRHFQISPVWRAVTKLRFLDGLVWTVGLA